jgi:hypothetical protein
MTSGVSYEVTRIAMIGVNGQFGTFEIPPSTNVWIQFPNNGISVFSNSSGNQVPAVYPANTLTNIPMFAGIFWDGTSWCGGSGANEQPGAGDASLTCYVDGTGAQLTTPVATPAVVNKLKIGTSSQLTIIPGAALTVVDSTFIRSPEGLVIASGPTGTGSFKNFANSTTVNKTIYENGGSATVQVYMLNSNGVGNLHIHMVGIPTFDPTLGDPLLPTPAYQSLQAFEMQDGGTYAYRYNEPTDAWVNISESTDLIPRMGAVALSDVSGVSKVLSFTGKINTGSINQPSAPAQWARSLTAGQGNGLFLFSNPYACGLRLDQFHLDNAARLNMIFWTWENDPAENYGVYFYDEEETFEWIGTLGIGAANGVIGPGQGFFGQYYALGNVRTLSAFNSSDLERVHAHTPILKSIPTNFLRLVAEGNSSKDEIIVRFTPKSTPGFDAKRDIENWPSMSNSATEIHTTAGENSLTVNSLPSLFPGEVTSVPMEFKCGAEGTYTITAGNIESFTSGTEIWLEDLKTGAEWHSLTINQVYEFAAGPDDATSRFVLHFFGPTGIDDPNSDISAVKIYGYGQDAYIVNRGKETIKEYVAYDLMGRELHRGTLPNSTVNKVTIGDVNAYYIVKVITKEGRIYTDKVYINK